MQKKHREFIMTIIESAVANLQKNEELINDLNVFPIPDGDTGSNMLATLLSAFKNISNASVTDVEILHDFARGALLGARGNSGVITSQIIKGLAEGAKTEGGISVDANSIRTILRSAKEYAYKSVSNPVEGTILSVVKAMDKNYNRNTTDLGEIAILIVMQNDIRKELVLNSVLSFTKKCLENAQKTMQITKMRVRPQSDFIRGISSALMLRGASHRPGASLWTC